MNLNDEYVYFHEFALQPVSPTPPPLSPDCDSYASISIYFTARNQQILHSKRVVS